MWLNTKEDTLFLGKNTMDYISFGHGKKILVMLPGLGDVLKSVKGKALSFALAYRIYAKTHTVYLFSRKNKLPRNYTTREMARDQAQAMNLLGLSKVNVLGVSQGGMIAQYLAIDYPELIENLVLAMTTAQTNAKLKETLDKWLTLVEKQNYQQLMKETAEKSYSAKYLKGRDFIYPFLGWLGKPTDEGLRFITQAKSCLTHDSMTELAKIKAPTFILGGGQDQVVGTEAAIFLADGITNSRLFVYEKLGHGAYEEAKDFNQQVLAFLNQYDEQRDS